MFITVHAAASAVIGKEIANPFIAFVISFVLHFIFDIIPHGDKDYCTRFFGLQFKRASEEAKFKSMALYSLIDTVILVFFLLYLFKNFTWAKDDSVIWAIIGGIIPDFIVALYMLTKSRWLKGFFVFHHENHSLIKRDFSLYAGMIFQAVILLGLISSLYLL
ncbi:MAG: hypothetical protein WC473_01855 [Patescibacteria group bacterium]|jgi:uncharacterized membrane protein YdcZ (DUF606 family)